LKNNKKELFVDEIKELFFIVEKLQQKYPHRKFTLDGRLVGDIGEVIVEENYSLILYQKQEKTYDGYSGDKKVQIKATFKDDLTFPHGEDNIPDYYIGIKLLNDGAFEEVYNGRGNNIWDLLKNRKKPPNGLH
jgi:hypothetical protein